MCAVAQWRSPSSGSCYNIHRFFVDLILRFPVVAHCRLLPALCLWRLACKHVWQVAFICLQACVAGCFHLQWHSFSVCFYGWSLSAPLSSSCLRFPALSQIQTTKGKITCTATRNKPTCSKPEICKSKASFPADLLSPCHTPVSKSIRQHHVEHHTHTQNHPSASCRDRRRAKHCHKMKIRTPLLRSTPGTRISEGCPWPLRAEWAPQGHREE